MGVGGTSDVEPYDVPSKVPKYGVCRACVLRIVMMVLSRYLIFGYLDPWGTVSTMDSEAKLRMDIYGLY